MRCLSRKNSSSNRRSLITHISQAHGSGNGHGGSGCSGGNGNGGCGGNGSGSGIQHTMSCTASSSTHNLAGKLMGTPRHQLQHQHSSSSSSQSPSSLLVFSSPASSSASPLLSVANNLRSRMRHHRSSCCVLNSQLLQLSSQLSAPHSAQQAPGTPCKASALSSPIASPKLHLTTPPPLATTTMTSHPPPPSSVSGTPVAAVATSRLLAPAQPQSNLLSTAHCMPRGSADTRRWSFASIHSTTSSSSGYGTCTPPLQQQQQQQQHQAGLHTQPLDLNVANSFRSSQLTANNFYAHPAANQLNSYFPAAVAAVASAGSQPAAMSTYANTGDLLSGSAAASYFMNLNNHSAVAADFLFNGHVAAAAAATSSQYLGRPGPVQHTVNNMTNNYLNLAHSNSNQA